MTCVLVCSTKSMNNSDLTIYIACNIIVLLLKSSTLHQKNNIYTDLLLASFLLENELQSEWTCWHSSVSFCRCVFRLLPSQCDSHLPQFTFTQTNNDFLRHTTRLHNNNFIATRFAAHRSFSLYAHTEQTNELLLSMKGKWRLSLYHVSLWLMKSHNKVVVHVYYHYPQE